MFLKIDPDVYYPEMGAGQTVEMGDGLPTGPTEPEPYLGGRPPTAPQIESLLASRGWRFSDDQIQFRNTVLLDLDHPEEDLLAAMKQKTRYNVRLARRRGVLIRHLTAAASFTAAASSPELSAALETFYQLYAETAERDGFVIRPPDYYLDAWRSFLEAGLAHLFLAEFEGEAVAGLVLFTMGPTAWYIYGASSNRQRKHMPNYLLQWEAMRAARAAGCTLYDLWGAPEEFVETDPMWGVVRFKLGLGGCLVRGLGAWDYPVSSLTYWLYTEVVPRYLGWLRKRGAA
jgi:lipid II:glycine glycyltransferase (peptidoglycan interpeptide bridge formation enzyme)